MKEIPTLYNILYLDIINDDTLVILYDLTKSPLTLAGHRCDDYINEFGGWQVHEVKYTPYGNVLSVTLCLIMNYDGTEEDNK